MSTPPAGLGELHRIHEQLRDLRQRQEQGGADDADVARLEVELRNAERQLPDNIRRAYERSVESKGLDAMSAVEDESCASCYQMLTLNHYNDLKLGRTVFCKGCGRLLYIEVV
jgi:predicted  nucleic acid-binding Zn-ribbon protein